MQPPSMERLTTVYVAAEGFTAELITELGTQVLEARGHLVLATGAPVMAAWARNIWYNPVFLPVTSISDGARKLVEKQRNWWLHSEANHRRAVLIQEKLPHVSAKPIRFGEKPPSAPLGSWTLWEPDLILAATDCSSVFPDGEVRFEENRLDPPSRAYLKLWEAFTVVPDLWNRLPGPGDLCLDLGSAPGGWTWVLAKLGAQVFSIDKAPLDPRVASMPQVTHCIGSGFGLDPRHVGEVDWLCSDMICYPERLYALMTRWLEQGTFRNAVCTLKFQAETDHAVAARFAALPGSTLRHLSCNKHELTWIYART